MVSTEAKQLSQQRAAAARRFTDAVMEQLTFLNMPDVVLQVAHTTGKLTIQGMDSMELLISANKGEAPKPLAKIASGGELSRIMLALKCVIADRDQIPTLIFDEIDTGVSGKAAQKIGFKLKEVGKNRQVLCVTHLSQIAVMANHHLLIEKSGRRTNQYPCNAIRFRRTGAGNRSNYGWRFSQQVDAAKCKRSFTTSTGSRINA